MYKLNVTCKNVALGNPMSLVIKIKLRSFILI